MKVVIQESPDHIRITHPIGHSAEKIASGLEGATIVDIETFPKSRIFRGAWRLDSDSLVVDLNAAKEICHTKRREVRAAEFAPWDTKATIPAEADHAETQRQDIRVKYAAIQENIDASEDAAELGSIYAAL